MYVGNQVVDVDQQQWMVVDVFVEVEFDLGQLGYDQVGQCCQVEVDIVEEVVGLGVEVYEEIDGDEVENDLEGV